MSSVRSKVFPRFSYRGIRFRLTALFVAIFGTTLIIFSTLLYQVFVRDNQGEFDAALYNHAVDVAEAIDVDLFGELSVRTSRLLEDRKVFPFAPGKAFLQIRSSDGKVLVRSQALRGGELPFDDADARMLAGRRVSFRTISISKTAQYRMVNYQMDRAPLPQLILQIAVPLTMLERGKLGLLTFFFVMIPLTLIVATLGGFFLSRRALAPVIAIIEKARGIDAGQLAERVPVPAVDDELRQLALTLNGLLNRLQQAFESQERFIADASHQLKTPLSILRGELDLMKSRARSPEEIAEFVDSASQEIDHLSKMVEDLLVLARVDAGIGSLSITKIRMDEVVMEAVARLERLSRGRRVKIRVNLGDGDFESRGDPDLLRGMVHNLVENAIKFSPEDGVVEVALTADAESVRVTVRDQGPGIPAEAMANIFERFFRAESTRAQAAGVGLGLAIASRIAQVHGGAIEAESALGAGSTFRARIKKL